MTHIAARDIANLPPNIRAQIENELGPVKQSNQERAQQQYKPGAAQQAMAEMARQQRARTKPQRIQRSLRARIRHILILLGPHTVRRYTDATNDDTTPQHAINALQSMLDQLEDLP